MCFSETELCACVRLCVCVCARTCLYLTQPINHGSDSPLISSLQLTLWSQEFQPLDMNATRRQIELERGLGRVGGGGCDMMSGRGEVMTQRNRFNFVICNFLTG